MEKLHAKHIRRLLLLALYDRYREDPLDMMDPADLLEACAVDRSDLAWNMHYLSDHKLIELMIGYSPHMFDSARLTAQGVDLVESPVEFDMRFPPLLQLGDGGHATVPKLIERLVQEGDLSHLGGEARKALHRDIQYLRAEISRPETVWRESVIRSVLDWLAEYHDETEEQLPSLAPLRSALEEGFKG